MKSKIYPKCTVMNGLNIQSLVFVVKDEYQLGKKTCVLIIFYYLGKPYLEIPTISSYYSLVREIS